MPGRAPSASAATELGARLGARAPSAKSPISIMAVLAHSALRLSLGRKVTGLAAALLALAGCDGSPRPVVLGVASPFSTTHGASMRQGVELGAREVNAGGGMQGRQLELRFLDAGADPDAALRAAHTFYEDDEVVAVVDHMGSGAMIHAGSVYEQGLPAVATSTTSVEIAGPGTWIFRVAPSEAMLAERLARAARESASLTAILYENDDYGRGLADGFRSAFEQAGGVVVSADPYLPSTSDFRPFLERMKMHEVGLVLVAGVEAEAARIIDQAREIGLMANFLGGDRLEALSDSDSAYDGTRLGLHFHPDASPKAAAFAARFRAEFGRDPDSFAALGYDAALLLVQAIREGGADRAAIRERLSKTGNGSPPHEGVTGIIRFDGSGDPVEKPVAVGRVSAGGVLLETAR